MNHQIILTDIELFTLGLTLFALTLAHFTIFLWAKQQINDIKQHFKGTPHHAIKN
jgi:hypothetical protein